MVTADLARHRNHILEAISIYEIFDLPHAACNHARLLEHITLSGNPVVLTGSLIRPPTPYDLLIRSQMILSEWSFRAEVTQEPQLKEWFQN